MPQLLRIFPYSAAQLTANDQYKRYLASWASRGNPTLSPSQPPADGPLCSAAGSDAAAGELSIPLRLVAGAMAGMSATVLTHPLDVLRLRLALPKAQYTGAARGCDTSVSCSD